MATVPARPQRISCVGFSQADRASLTCLLGLLTPYLRPPWELVEHPEQADLCLLRLDGEALPPITHRRLIGCAQHPRQWPAGTLHRPLRAAQLLALLSDDAAGPGEAEIPAQSRAPVGTTQPFRLLAWPLDTEHAPSLRTDVLAALSAGPDTVESLAGRIGACRQQVLGVIESLCRAGVLAREAEQLPSPPVPVATVPGWRGFMAGLGRRLGIVST
ncbi:MAG: hypothetical protein WCY72_11120 [Lysobacteraceae bacterium]|nr:hypothetical protein [Gammaproteobacteria bacterium]